MKLITCGIACIFFSMASLTAVAQERYQHYEGEEAASFEEALANFAEYNEKLEQILAGELEAADMAEIHQLTYTLENALERINLELAQLAETLEVVHLGSERMEYEGVREAAMQYLETARKIEK
ncbi:hypothetical protein CWE08_06910 [Aliidiomarina iranensis]|uniref:Uncharacterized protein n=1 Tax=Aliidiomarina iranensis TaxID=1434071 RepID=A0A432VW98_9GAMM|nr:DUF6746 family protein [Aliidiomarina iranensis]RUO20825.1 hypothetical protein CWE08_06910 [Aliidiomarina iranensis]